jgi:hypothetical protein
LHRKLPGKLFGLFAAVMWLGAACTTLVKADRSKVPDDLYHPTDAGSGVGGATGSDGGDAAVGGDAADAPTPGDAADAATPDASDDAGDAADAAALDVPPADGSPPDLSLD